ncbi:primosome assembly protein PriA [Kineococcus sp. T13]|uniref:primosomal protein N' family DNA-binding protein n=1 Tax=Kineococcus vitellinus TaxID=2696565 RepID=UPI001412D8CA|nr:primosome assembly protein PriA [Kineococcus vitellinus]
MKKAAGKPRPKKALEGLAGSDPVARVLVTTQLPHLDRPFDYLVPASMEHTAEPGRLVRVPFAGTDAEGYVLERLAASEHPGRLARLRRVVSGLPVLSPQVLELCRQVAREYAGTLSDVVRLAVPGRHAGAEEAVLRAEPVVHERLQPAADTAGWERHAAGPAFLAHVAGGASPRAVATFAPGTDPFEALAVAARAALVSGRTALLVVPDHRDLDRLAGALARRVPEGGWVRLEAETGPAARYTAFCEALTGRARVVAGTRAAVFAPLPNLGLLAVLDDGDDSHAEQRAPYPHAREVAVLRAQQTGAAALLAGRVRTAEGQLLLESGWARAVVAGREVVRACSPRVLVAGTTGPDAQDPLAAAARLPGDGWRVLREAVRRGPVLVQVPRTGYVPTLACQTCREPARCTACHGPLALPDAGERAACRWCGRPATDWACPNCGDGRFRALVTGARRTAEELGRAFPGVDVRTSGGSRVLDRVPALPSLVICTPGAEPVVEGAAPGEGGGYAAALLLDGWALLARPDLRAQEEAFRRWTSAAALVRPAAAGGAVVVVADPQVAAVQALVRWDPAGFAERELGQRRELDLPPAARFAGLIGAVADVDAVVEALPPLEGLRVLGPTPVPERPGQAPAVRTVLRVPRERSAELAAGLKDVVAGRSVRKQPLVRVRVDPLQIG